MRSVSPRQTKGRPGYLADFFDAKGKRRTRGLGTKDHAAALVICAALEAMRAAGLETIDQAPPGVPAKALELYFGKHARKAAPLSRMDAAPFDPHGAELPDTSAYSEPAAAHVIALHLTAQRLAADRDRWRAMHEALDDQHQALRSSSIGQATLAAERCPPIAAALDRFGEHMHTTATAKHAGECERLARTFAESLPASIATTAQITAEHIGRWLDVDAAGAPSPVTRRAKRRALLGRFVNWASGSYGHPSPMLRVSSATRQQLERERGAIDWHDLPEVEAALAGLPDDYWRAVVACLAFAGLRLAELAWLRVEDFTAQGDRHQLWIASVDDGHGCRHDLKTGHSRRAVDVHPGRLLPLLESQRARVGELFLFPMPPGVKRRTRAKGHPERWDTSTLSRYLGGIPWRGRAGLLPAGMNARSLRRTFGSLLLRSGRTVEQVAAAMGNTPAVVQRHYARILGSEVSVEF